MLNSAAQEIISSVETGCAPLIGVEFSHTFPNATNIEWTFGNGASSTNASAVTTYQNPGVYEVVFTADPNIQESIFINVLASPIADFEVITSSAGCIPMDVTFADNSQSSGSAIINWAWDFGDGGVIDGGESSPTHTYTLLGVNDVTLVIEDENGCEGSISYPDLIIASTAPDLTLVSDPANTSACNPPLNVNYSAVATSNSPATDELTYSWDLGGAGNSDQPNPPPLNYTEDGSYPISLVVTDDAGCSSETSDIAFVGSPQAEWELVGGPNFCDTVYFVNLSDAATTTVDWGNGTGGGVNSALDTLMHVYPFAGTFTATITTSSPGCEDSDEVTVIIDDVQADFVSSPQFSCNPELTTTYTSTSIGAESYLWIFGNDSIEDVSETEYTHVSTGSVDPFADEGAQVFGATLEIVSAGGCFSSTSISNDTIWLPFSYMAVDINDGCAPVEVTFSDSSSAPDPIVLWEYHTGDGTILPLDTSGSVTYEYNEAGNFDSFLVITTEAGCMDTSLVIPIGVGEPLNTQLDIGPTTVCPGQTVDFEPDVPNDLGIDMWSIETDNNQMSACPYEPNSSGSFNAFAGNHDVTVYVNYNGCVSETIYENAVEVLGPVGHFYSELDCENPYTVEFIGDITGADSWTYDFGDGDVMTSSTDQNVEHTYSSTGDYTVTLTSFSSTGCPPFVETLEVKVREIQASLETPDLFCENSEITLDGSNSQDVYEANSDGYAWVFDAGMSIAPYRSADATSTFQEFNSGSFEIDLIVYDVNGCSDTATVDLDVFGVDVEIGFEVTDGCIPFEAEFWDLTTTDTLIVDRLWTFEGSETSSDSALTFLFDDAFDPPYQISLTITDELGCTGTGQINLSPDLPSATFNASDTQVCSEEEINFSANNPNYESYEWDFGIEGLIGSEPNPTHKIHSLDCLRRN
ncbi:MAG: PKD domain-containing protein [Bacteroidota bacterium]